LVVLSPLSSMVKVLVVMLDVGEAEHLGSSVSALDCF
jgi:hypothetical protein